MQLIKDIMSFMATRDIRIITANENDHGYEDFVMIAFEILGWLKLEHKRTLWKQTRRYMKQKPLKLNFNYTWCDRLKNIELIIRVWDYPNKQNGHGPAGAGFGRFPGVWPHSLCLLR